MSSMIKPRNYVLTTAIAQAKASPGATFKKNRGGKAIPAFNGKKSKRPITLPKLEVDKT